MRSLDPIFVSAYPHPGWGSCPTALGVEDTAVLRTQVCRFSTETVTTDQMMIGTVPPSALHAAPVT
jgi:hypothetical protein